MTTTQMIRQSFLKPSDVPAPETGVWGITVCADIKWVKINILVSDSTLVDFMADDLAVVKIQRDPDWRTKALARIEDIRKGDITVR